jgi:hypothetical protein
MHCEASTKHGAGVLYSLRFNADIVRNTRELHSTNLQHQIESDPGTAKRVASPPPGYSDRALAFHGGQRSGIPSLTRDRIGARLFRPGLGFLIPALRADITALENYVYEKEDPLDCPIYAFGGSFDPTAKEQDLAGWRLHTTRAFELKIFDGNHFFRRNNQRCVFSSILAKLSQVPQLAPVDR